MRPLSRSTGVEIFAFTALFTSKTESINKTVIFSAGKMESLVEALSYVTMGERILSFIFSGSNSQTYLQPFFPFTGF